MTGATLGEEPDVPDPHGTAGEPAFVGTRAESIDRADPALPIVTAASLEEKMIPLTSQDRTTARLALVFGAVALTLAAIGLYGAPLRHHPPDQRNRDSHCPPARGRVVSPR